MVRPMYQIQFGICPWDGGKGRKCACISADSQSQIIISCAALPDKRGTIEFARFDFGFAKSGNLRRSPPPVACNNQNANSICQIMHFLAISWANGWATMIKLEIRRAIVILSMWSPWQYLFDKDYSTSVQRLEFKIWKIILCAAGLKEFLHLVLDPARCMENELTLQIVWRTNWRFLTDKICKTASSLQPISLTFQL